jgi:hypothetical protein
VGTGNKKGGKDMKRVFIIYWFCICLLFGCTSTGSGGSSSNEYREVELTEAKNIALNNGRQNYNGYFLTKDLIVARFSTMTGGNLQGIVNTILCVPLNLGDNIYYGFLSRDYAFDRVQNGEYIIVNSGIESELEQFSVITAWYRVEKKEYVYVNFYLERFEVTDVYTGAIEKKMAIEGQIADANAERQQPRYSPEGNEYIKRNLAQVAGEVANTANRGKTLFFETSNISMKEGVTTGQWLITEFMGSNSPTIMYYYNNIGIRVLPTILYRVEISNIGFAKYTIDSFR